MTFICIQLKAFVSVIFEDFYTLLAWYCFWNIKVIIMKGRLTSCRGRFFALTSSVIKAVGKHVFEAFLLVYYFIMSRKNTMDKILFLIQNYINM